MWRAKFVWGLLTLLGENLSVVWSEWRTRRGELRVEFKELNYENQLKLRG